MQSGFYLGRRHEGGHTTDEPILYDSQDLTTHAVCVGMTGSGKTGLCIALLEEAALSGVPSIVIDPKGDLANLALRFPSLLPADFAPWVSADDARRKGISVDDLATTEAERWRAGLAKWDEDGARIQRFCDAADVVVYTPGSRAASPLSILGSFQAPPPTVRDNPEALGEKVAGTVSALLGLIGVDTDPLQSRAHILLSTLLLDAWSAGRDLDLAGLVALLPSPPISRVGVLDLESFFPAKERMALAMAINNLLASPSFSRWLDGPPLDVASLLWSATGKPQISVLSLAHLGDPERMFFVTLLLSQVLAWLRAQPGSSSLRAVLYMDEIAGYFPPVANPPSKLPLLTLLKQARAFGLGVVLSTQNPVDLDYKGLGNAGTWIIGRLQTARDRARLVAGLESAGLDGAALDETLAGLGSRVFLLHDVHRPKPTVFESRWAMSYLRGPLGRDELARLPRAAKVLVAPRKPLASRPVLAADIVELFVVPSGPTTVDKPTYAPMAYAAVEVRFVDKKLGLDHLSQTHCVAPITDAVMPVDWSALKEVSYDAAQLGKQPVDGAEFLPLPSVAARAKTWTAIERELGRFVAGNAKLQLWRCEPAKMTSFVDEKERDFRARLQQALAQTRDAELVRLRAKWDPKLASLAEKIRRAEASVDQLEVEVSQGSVETAVSLGATLLGALVGKKTLSSSTIGRAASTARGAGRAKQKHDAANRARTALAALVAQRAEQEAALHVELEAAEALADPARALITPLVVSAKKTAVAVRLLCLAWTPI